MALIKHSGSLETTHYLHKDHLGNVSVITDEQANVSEELSYDAWGHPEDWSPATAPLYPTATPRGYTGHEHLDDVGIIHMNGRVYDPMLGRMLSADPLITHPGYSQSYNRYSYVLNNPLRYTDPSGFETIEEIVIRAPAPYPSGTTMDCPSLYLCIVTGERPSQQPCAGSNYCSWANVEDWLWVNEGLNGGVNNTGYPGGYPDGSGPGVSHTTPAAEAASNGQNAQATAGRYFEKSVRVKVYEPIEGSRLKRKVGLLELAERDAEKLKKLRNLIRNELKAALSEFSKLPEDLAKVAYDGNFGGDFTPRNIIHMPKSMLSCQDFISGCSGSYIALFIHAITHVWQFYRRNEEGRLGPVWGHILSGDLLPKEPGEYLPKERYVNTPSTKRLNTEEEADWHMWHFMCSNRYEEYC
ncbi:MAG: RHS repeat-associated core domain-containing protein [Gammaproteobacteria bacterium]|nr:MAG: RHS repeat-associated core domain-containing protein [Gammaproteobacteria bacterium]